ncbi:hypothetical protein QBC43DRAFT_332215 [Cladorrhinum sp. PSN259]|nr:hypothetical protein QBC43DRAFT_332215 [Cladorrhinum sp. PSN259]
MFPTDGGAGLTVNPHDPNERRQISREFGICEEGFSCGCDGDGHRSVLHIVFGVPRAGSAGSAGSVSLIQRIPASLALQQVGKISKKPILQLSRTAEGMACLVICSGQLPVALRKPEICPTSHRMSFWVLYQRQRIALRIFPCAISSETTAAMFSARHPRSPYSSPNSATSTADSASKSMLDETSIENGNRWMTSDGNALQIAEQWTSDKQRATWVRRARCDLGCASLGRWLKLKVLFFGFYLGDDETLPLKRKFLAAPASPPVEGPSIRRTSVAKSEMFPWRRPEVGLPPLPVVLALLPHRGVGGVGSIQASWDFEAFAP